MLQTVLEKNEDEVKVQYKIWIGNNVNLAKIWRLNIPANLTVYDVIETIAGIDKTQKAEYSVVDGKPYITSMCGMENDPETNNYWFSYLRLIDSDEKPRVIKESPVDVRVQKNQEIILWYKTERWSEQSIVSILPSKKKKIKNKILNALSKNLYTTTEKRRLNWQPTKSEVGRTKISLGAGVPVPKALANLEDPSRCIDRGWIRGVSEPVPRYVNRGPPVASEFQGARTSPRSSVGPFSHVIYQNEQPIISKDEFQPVTVRAFQLIKRQQRFGEIGLIANLTTRMFLMEQLVITIL
ncbi:uncharacterized protein CEXT_361451 [Caerostris extrusa]|uniref:DUF4430 domain-containing protein n=1 Tax=Caerostris extrusa TaxID=172846 RepID=A0AAV4PXJ8_CAEEX|nr:uncharacterized protein CEXT_361451 [Caerostris extrusa]